MWTFGWMLAATAAEPQVRVADDGAVVAEVVVAAPEAAVRALLADPEATASLTDEIRAIEARPKGGCHEVHVATRGPWDDLEYVALRCPTDAGVEERLVRSDDFARNDVTWTVEAVDGGTRVRYRVDTVLEAPVPASLVRRGVRASVERTLRRLAERLAS